jgi:hypothetical protein
MEKGQSLPRPKDCTDAFARVLTVVAWRPVATASTLMPFTTR